MVDAKTSVEESVAVQGTAPCVSPSVFLVLSRSLANVTQLRPAGVRLQVVAIETAVSETDNRASSTCIFNIITLDHLKKLKENAFVGNTGHFSTRSTLQQQASEDRVPDVTV